MPRVVVNLSDEDYDLLVHRTGKPIEDPLALDRLVAAVGNGSWLEGMLGNIKTQCWDHGVNMTGERQGVWVSYRVIEQIVNQYIKPKEGS